jgi:hypothetical protein
MEAMYFAVGVLTMVLVALAALAVYSTVMVLKLKKRTEEMNSKIYRRVQSPDFNGLPPYKLRTIQ